MELQRLDDRQLELSERFGAWDTEKLSGKAPLIFSVQSRTDVLICENENGKPEVAVYHDRDDRKPARGEKLNRPAVITLEKVHAGSSRLWPRERCGLIF